ncbi:M28 family peptidase [Balneolales bacterium ANBcel1]|nr:M28 family peptidase [Balneolales bacterium ANBcel1]
MKSFTTHLCLTGTLFFLIISCSPDNGEVPLPGPLSEADIMEHVEVLASDEFGGRAPGTVHEEMTVEYIADQFERFGLEPGMPGGSWTQPVPLMAQQTHLAELTLSTDGEALNYLDDFMAWPAHVQESVEVNEAELIYVGYGIEAPEEEWDDFKGTDVSGKVLVFKNFNPVTFEDRFDGGNRLYYGRWTYKFEQAIAKGALGAFIIHTDETAGYGWDIVRNSWSRERFFVFDDEGHNTEFSGWLTHDRSRELFEAAGLDLDDMLAAAEDPAFEPVPMPNVTVNLSLQADYRSIEGQNVVGKLPGSDPILADEAVVFSAHHDHLGIGTPVDGDSIFNGAWDNASGVSLLINMGRLFAMESEEIRRTLYFAAVTAEESGLLGSQYFAENPPVHAGKISANINLDATNIFGKTRDFVAIGYGRSDIDGILDEEARRLGRTVKPDPRPEQGIYYRSDHFSFARQGIPALYPNPGTDFVDKPDNFNDQVAEYREKIYHTVHDKVHDWWDLSGAVEDMKLIYRVAKRIANADAMRQWVPGGEFEQARINAMEEAAALPEPY